MGVIEEAFDGDFLDGPVHPLDLSVGPGMVGLGQTVADAMTKTDAIEGMSTPSCRKSSYKQSSSGRRVCLRNATMTAS